jgi:hypothetical protein
LSSHCRQGGRTRRGVRDERAPKLVTIATHHTDEHQARNEETPGRNRPYSVIGLAHLDPSLLWICATRRDRTRSELYRACYRRGP